MLSELELERHRLSNWDGLSRRMNIGKVEETIMVFALFGCIQTYLRVLGGDDFAIFIRLLERVMVSQGQRSRYRSVATV